MNRGRKIKVLVVDDVKHIRENLCILLENIPGIRVIAGAENGEVAVKIACESKPDVVIMDIGMPVMNGIEATRRIVEDAPDVKVIAFTASSDNGAIEQMFKAGASGLLPKGCEFEEIVSAINTAVTG